MIVSGVKLLHGGCCLQKTTEMFTILHLNCHSLSPHLLIPTSYEIQETGPVQLISYASDTESGYLKLLDEEDLPRFVRCPFVVLHGARQDV